MAVATSPDVAPASGAVQARLDRVRQLATEDAHGAQAEAWAWIVEAGERIALRREEALRELGELFRAGTPSTGLDGRSEGRLVGFTIHPAADRLIAALTHAWMPWLGKRFDAASNTGTNLLRSSARSQLKVLWPSYTPIETDGNLEAFSFRTRLAPGEIDPDVTVLKIDYDSEENPNLIIRRILDELVRVEDGIYLGKILYRTSRSWRPIGFFSLTA